MPAHTAIPDIYSDARQDTRLPTQLRDAIRGIAEHHDRSTSDEVRRALDFWTVVAAAATHADAQVTEHTDPDELDARRRHLHHVACRRLEDAFPGTDPAAILAALAPQPSEAR